MVAQSSPKVEDSENWKKFPGHSISFLIKLFFSMDSTFFYIFMKNVEHVNLNPVSYGKNTDMLQHLI